MSQLKADISPPLKERVFDPSPHRHPFLTPQSGWTEKNLFEQRHMQRMLLLGYTKFKVTSRCKKGQAELLRMMFYFAGIPFTDEVLSETDWKSLICKTPYGNLPVLWMDHNVYGEMNCIIRLLAGHLTLMGTNEKEALVAGSVFEQAQALKEMDTMQKAYEEYKERPDDNFEQIFEVILPSRFSEWERLIEESNGPFILPSGICLADMAIFDFISQYRDYLPIDNVVLKYKNIERHIHEVYRHPRLQTYFHGHSAKNNKFNVNI